MTPDCEPLSIDLYHFTNCQITAADTEITIEFAGGVGVKRLLLSFAPLEKI